MVYELVPDNNEREAFASSPEDVFVELFAQVFGVANVQLLVHEYPVEDIYGGGRSIDYALRTAEGRIAFEIDGLTWHLPAAIGPDKFEDDLLRQNSLIHQGWRVFRWTDRQLALAPERVKEQLALFLERIPGLLSFDDFLPRQSGDLFELRGHQVDALASLAQMRVDGKTIALLTHAQGAGKTIVAICDAKKVGGRTLFLVHRKELVEQAYLKLQDLWPEVSTGLFLGDVRDFDDHNIAASIQSVSEHLNEFLPTAFKYLIIDEAHHATAATYKRILGYFKPEFVLGLTATPERADGESLLEIFRECAHRLTLQEAVERGELVPIRCIRVITNIDLSRVKFNQIQYNRKDIEETVIIPARDRLIVETYLSHVSGRKAVAFCVNVRHGESIAEMFRLAGVPARSVSGRMPRLEREKYLKEYRDGSIQVLCACDILNEGWDCPDVEVLLMARPTLSKVVYLQQLGRGTRKAPGKECMTVIDFVDNATRYNQSLSLHRVTNFGKYRPGGLVLAPSDLLQAEDLAIQNGARPTTVVEIGLWAKEYVEIDVFNWQEAITGMTSVTELEVELAASEGLVRRAIDRGEIVPDHTVKLGERSYYYFTRERVDEIRQTLGLQKVEKHNIKELFLAYASDIMDMSASYKPVMLLSVLDNVDSNGRASLKSVVSSFRQFYERRRALGLVVEKPTSRLARIEDLDDAAVQRVMIEMPFEKFERRKYLQYARDLAFVKFTSLLWKQLVPTDLAELRIVCEKNIERYYERIKPS
ncbi:MAG: DEAD/DEAH box helicase family protein [Schlesneria sp.]